MEYIEDNGVEYMIIKRIKLEGQKYVLVSNVDDPEDFTIRKEVIKDGRELVVELSSTEEFDKVLPYFMDVE